MFPAKRLYLVFDPGTSQIACCFHFLACRELGWSLEEIINHCRDFCNTPRTFGRHAFCASGKNGFSWAYFTGLEVWEVVPAGGSAE